MRLNPELIDFEVTEKPADDYSRERSVSPFFTDAKTQVKFRAVRNRYGSSVVFWLQGEDGAMLSCATGSIDILAMMIDARLDGKGETVLYEKAMKTLDDARQNLLFGNTLGAIDAVNIAYAQLRVLLGGK